tara:strand:+ start:13903 stop:14259 length:357 start_codon:yes stop_codon:yes gene_type:complete
MELKGSKFKMNKIEIATKKYFTFWSNKNIEGLTNLFHDEIVLQDWENLIKGKNAVVKFNEEFFKKVNDIRLNIIFLDSFNNTSFSELKIDLDGNTISVLDKIEFNENELIKNIRAYKG